MRGGRKKCGKKIVSTQRATQKHGDFFVFAKVNSPIRPLAPTPEFLPKVTPPLAICPGWGDVCMWKGMIGDVAGLGLGNGGVQMVGRCAL